jgi:hypothetical protein
LTSSTSGDSQAHDLGRADGSLGEGLVELHRLGLAAAMDVAPELVPLGGAAHRRHHPVADDEGADVPPLAFGHELLDQHVLPAAVQRLDDGLRHLLGVSEDDTDPLGSLEQLDDDRRAADAADGRQHVPSVANEGRRRDHHVVAAEDLQGA